MGTSGPGGMLSLSARASVATVSGTRSPRKSAMDLFKAGVISLTPLASLGAKDWDYEDRRRVVVQRSAVTRVRPAMKQGWSARFEFAVQLPEYIAPELLHHALTLDVRGNSYG